MQEMPHFEAERWEPKIGDEVKILRGHWANWTGKIIEIHPLDVKIMVNRTAGVPALMFRKSNIERIEPSAENAPTEILEGEVRQEDVTKESNDQWEPKVGNTIRVTSGQFANFSGQITAIGTGGKFDVLLKVFSNDTPWQLDKSEMEPYDDE